jgi:thiol-disulfide isomerase/thioredoxin
MIEFQSTYYLGTQIVIISHMNRFKLILLLAFFTSTIVAQTSTTYSAGNEGWMVDLDKAYAASLKEGKPIMANFTGSDWCGWCKRLTASVFSKQEFKDWAEDNVILLELDFPRRTQIPAKYKQQNSGLQQAFKVSGYPTIWLFNLGKNADSGKYEIAALGKTGYAASVGDFTGAIDQMINQ